ncbi:MAG TPA: 4Fe-4S dicluster domain-containing protein [Euryarchaeota archaeon]|nr:anaerobic dimethyl sulfoxide reductase chain B [archaeon BMS3Bbin15]HDL14772.1 4Fe-4S dicluster domain-containing protein [Euryarchaeota archaeon]
MNVEVFEGYGMQEVDQKEPSDSTVVMFIDIKRCIGCFSCETSCKMEHELGMGPRNIRVIQIGPKKVDGRVKTLYMPMPCYHCSPAACVESCPTGAMQKRGKDGIVFVDSEACIGCKRCMQACPYGAPQYDSKTGKVIKCDFCMHRVDYRKTYTKEDLKKIYRYSYDSVGVASVASDEIGNVKRDDKGRLVNENGEVLVGRKLAEKRDEVEEVVYEGLWGACSTKCSTEAMKFGYYRNLKGFISGIKDKRRIFRIGSVFYAMPNDDFPISTLKQK